MDHSEKHFAIDPVAALCKKPMIHNISDSDNNTSYAMSTRERRQASILVVDSDTAMRNSLRHALISLGFDDLHDAPDSNSALEKLETKEFTHVIFEAKNTTMPAVEFLARALEKNNLLIAIPTSYEPTVDDVFDLIISGARGYIVKPFTSGSIDEVMVWATKGEPISEAILHTRGRNEALASLVLDALDKLAIVLRQAERFQTAKFEIPKRQAVLHKCMDMARTFAKGGDPELRSTIVQLAIERSEHIETRYASFRKREKKALKPKEAPADASISALTQSHQTESSTPPQSTAGAGVK